MTKRRGPKGAVFTPEDIARHVCIGCGVNVIEAGEYCLINVKIWRDKLGLKWEDNMCIACVETRIGRKLNFLDFVSFPFVEGIVTSNVLIDRYGLTDRVKALLSKPKASRAKKRTSRS